MVDLYIIMNEQNKLGEIYWPLSRLTHCKEP